MRLVDAAIKKYRLTVLGIILLLILGGLTYITMPRREDPLIKVPGATVLVHYPGAGSRDIERYVSRNFKNICSLVIFYIFLHLNDTYGLRTRVG